ncbi:transposase [Novosphingobium sp. AP12]|uniref:transposase n=1 Tax=Novosphingobium sp. AP12 TaxID=1144305 RepID=UPI00350F51FE
MHPCIIANDLFLESRCSIDLTAMENRRRPAEEFGQQATKISFSRSQRRRFRVALSEAEVHWRGFLDDLVARGMRGVEFIVSDDHAGLRAARRAVLGSATWQRCQFHLAANAIHTLPTSPSALASAQNCAASGTPARWQRHRPRSTS